MKTGRRSFSSAANDDVGLVVDAFKALGIQSATAAGNGKKAASARCGLISESGWPIDDRADVE